jgi:Ca-activated chloride channel family protein
MCARWPQISIFVIVFAMSITLGFSGIPLSVVAQEPTHPVSPPPNTVSLFATVLDRNGHIVGGLKQDDFQVFEDGKEQKPTRFALAESQPLVLGLLMQWSGQRRNTLPYAEIDVAPKLFESIARPGNNVFLAGFTDKIMLFSDFADDPSELVGKLRKAIGTPLYGPRALFNAIIWACDTKLSTMPGRKALLLVADGMDNSSRAGITAAVEAALHSDSAIYIVSLVPANPVFPDEGFQLQPMAQRNLNELAERTGGRVIPVLDKPGMEAAFLQLSNELRGQYVLGYTPASPGKKGKLRKVEIKVSQKGLRVVSREGYYASTK